MPILSIIQKSVIEHNLNDKQIYIACSGGRDSMALLYACMLLKLPIRVLHINHKLQQVSDEWQILVENFCKRNNIVCLTEQLNWQNSVISEAQARTARYQAFCYMTNANPIIATAHHANDQAETVLMNLCQGAGLVGLSGIKPFSTQYEFAKPLQLWRPLLAVSREMISDFVAKHELPFVDDPTNFGDDNSRAFLRNQILPLLNKKFNKSIENIARSSQNVAESKQIIDDIVKQDLQFCQLPRGIFSGEKTLCINQLQKIGQERVFQLLHTWIKGEQNFAPSRQIIEQVYQLIFSENPEQQTLIQWQTIQIRRYHKILYRLDKDYFNRCRNQQSFVKIPSHYGIRSVFGNEKLQLLYKPHHQSFKKICRNLQIPVWQRQFCYVVLKADVPIAVCFLDRCWFLVDFL